ncbi:MAG: hypothetical protein KatS3mg076_1353 [Candidatus Binatia bacterium]|nr:MAG: hypothetical protein KatS3mg076_1353 [Candidatus Binatia bacterium]
MDTVVQRLNELLEAERAGVEVASRLLSEASGAELRELLERVRGDEAWSCAGLARAAARLGGPVSQGRGDFAAKVIAEPTLAARLQLLNRGQGWVVKRLEALLAEELPSEVGEFLREMKQRHVANIEACNRFLERSGERPANPAAREGGALYRFLAADHARLDALLRKAVAADRVDGAAYAEFRAGLLKHIAMEEKILLPEVQRRRGGEPLPIAARLRLEHGAIAALLVPPPTRAVAAALRSVLEAHNATEEGPGGLYRECERILDGDGDEVAARLREAPEVPVAPHVDSPKVRAATRRALERADFGEVAAQLERENGTA